MWTDGRRTDAGAWPSHFVSLRLRKLIIVDFFSIHTMTAPVAERLRALFLNNLIMSSLSLFFFFFFFFFNSVLRPFHVPGTPASRTWLVSHVARSGLEPTPFTAVR